MKNYKVIGVILLAVAVIALLSLLLVGGVGAGMQNNGERITCDGTVEVDFLGVGNPSLDPQPVCEVSACTRLFSLSDLILPGVEKGEVRLEVNGKEVEKFPWESRIGENERFTMQSSCVASIDSASVILYSKDRARLETYTFR